MNPTLILMGLMGLMLISPNCPIYPICVRKYERGISGTHGENGGHFGLKRIRPFALFVLPGAGASAGHGVHCFPHMDARSDGKIDVFVMC